MRPGHRRRHVGNGSRFGLSSRLAVWTKPAATAVLDRVPVWAPFRGAGAGGQAPVTRREHTCWERTLTFWYANCKLYAASAL